MTTISRNPEARAALQLLDTMQEFWSRQTGEEGHLLLRLHHVGS